MKGKKMHGIPAMHEMPAFESRNTFGHWIFVLGFLLAVVEGFFPETSTGTVLWVLLLLGALVGYLNITKEETTSFLIATTSLIVLSLAKFSLTQIPPKEFGLFLANAIGNLTLFIVPAALIVTVKAIYALAKD